MPFRLLVQQAAALFCCRRPQNIVVDERTNDVTLIDFGLARVQTASVASAPHTMKYIGAKWYRSPELLCNIKDYTNATDMWSFGVVVAELLTTLVPFPYLHLWSSFEIALITPPYITTPLLPRIVLTVGRHQRAFPH